MNRPLTGALLLSALQLAFAQSFAQATPSLPHITLDARQQAALGVRTVAVQPAGPQNLLASATVTVSPGHEISVTAPFSGVIVRLDAGLGDSVRNGAPLALLSSPQLADARRQLREAELEARNAQAALERDQVMHNEGIISAARLQSTHNRQRATDAAWQAQASALKATGLGLASDYASGQLLAPRAGTLVEATARVGQRVEAGDLLFRVADLRHLQLDITLSGDKAARVNTGDVVNIPSHEARATLIGVNRSLDASQQARARARVTVPGRLLPGDALQVQLQPSSAKGVAPAWQVPARALIQMQGQSWVLVATPQGYAPTRVQVVSSNDDLAAVLGPLDAQQRVASTGLAALRPLLQKAD